jgi:hypothetical protein
MRRSSQTRLFLLPVGLFFAEHQRNFSQESDSGKMELRIARDMPRITLNESRLRRIPLKTLLI